MDELEKFQNEDGDIKEEVDEIDKKEKNDNKKEDNKLPSSIKIAIVGQPNVGKSSLLNYLLHEKRVLVSKEPGTTHDPVDHMIEWQGLLLSIISFYEPFNKVNLLL